MRWNEPANVIRIWPLMLMQYRSMFTRRRLVFASVLFFVIVAIALLVQYLRGGPPAPACSPFYPAGTVRPADCPPIPS